MTRAEKGILWILGTIALFSLIGVLFSQINLSKETRKSVVTPIDNERKRQSEINISNAQAATDRKYKVDQVKPQWPKSVNANISFDEFQIRIRNADGFAWPELNVYINGQPPFSYGCSIRALAPGEAIRIPLNQFSKTRTGERFNPASYRIVELWIGGGDYDYAKYGF